jgi:hypothetical protein
MGRILFHFYVIYKHFELSIRPKQLRKAGGGGTLQLPDKYDPPGIQPVLSSRFMIFVFKDPVPPAMYCKKWKKNG